MDSGRLWIGILYVAIGVVLLVLGWRATRVNDLRQDRAAETGDLTEARKAPDQRVWLPRLYLFAGLVFLGMGGSAIYSAFF